MAEEQEPKEEKPAEPLTDAFELRMARRKKEEEDRATAEAERTSEKLRQDYLKRTGRKDMKP